MVLYGISVDMLKEHLHTMASKEEVSGYNQIHASLKGALTKAYRSVSTLLPSSKGGDKN